MMPAWAWGAAFGAAAGALIAPPFGHAVLAARRRRNRARLARGLPTGKDEVLSIAYGPWVALGAAVGAAVAVMSGP